MLEKTTMMCDMNDSNNKLCYSCRSSAKKMIECNELISKMMPRNFCESCVIGKEVPVFRRSLQIWSFGQVKSFDQSNSMHTVEFLSGDSETIRIGRTPFRSYQNQDEDEDESNTTMAMGQSSSSSTLPSSDNTGNSSEEQTCYEPITIPFDSDEYSPGKTRKPSVQFFADDPCWDLLSDLIGPHNDSSAAKTPAFDSAITNVTTPTTTNTTHVIDAREPCMDDRSNNNGYGNGHEHTRSSPIPLILEDTKNNNNNNIMSTNTKKRQLSFDDNDSSAPQHQQQNKQKSRKICPQMWKPEEDQTLIRVVNYLSVQSSSSSSSSSAQPVNSTNIKWPIVAQHLPHRTAKQCRERYLNQLDPELKLSEWSSEEDVVIFNLYSLFGAQWAKIASLIPGRTDNSVKNRFHHLRRKMEKACNHGQNKQTPTAKLGREYQSQLISMCNNDNDNDNAEQQQQQQHNNNRTSFQKKVTRVVGYAVAKALQNESADVCTIPNVPQIMEVGDQRFRSADTATGEQCKRCCLFLPSKHCGTRLCKYTGWCETCTQIPAYITRDCLYDAMKLVNNNIDTHTRTNK